MCLVFLAQLGLVTGTGEEDRMGQGHSDNSYRVQVLPVSLIPVNVDLDHLPGAAFVRLLHWGIIPIPLLMLYHLQTNIQAKPTSNEYEHMLPTFRVRGQQKLGRILFYKIIPLENTLFSSVPFCHFHSLSWPVYFLKILFLT